MKNNKKGIFVVTAVCLLFSSLAFASFEQPDRVIENTPLPQFQAVPEQITTNVLLRQILAELIKANTVKSDNRCNIGNGYPEWRNDCSRRRKL